MSIDGKGVLLRQHDFDANEPPIWFSSDCNDPPSGLSVLLRAIDTTPVAGVPRANTNGATSPRLLAAV